MKSDENLFKHNDDSIILAVINIKERRLEYYDSMSKGYNDAVLSLLKYYVEEEYKDKKKVSSYAR